MNPPNGRSAARTRIYDIDEMFPGPRAQHLPDLVITWDPEAHVLVAGSGEAGGSGRAAGAAIQTPPYYSGNHRPNAFVLARGPVVSRAGGARGAAHRRSGAYTFRMALGVDPPAHFEGRAWAGSAG